MDGGASRSTSSAVATAHSTKGMARASRRATDAGSEPRASRPEMLGTLDRAPGGRLRPIVKLSGAGVGAADSGQRDVEAAPAKVLASDLGGAASRAGPAGSGRAGRLRPQRCPVVPREARERWCLGCPRVPGGRQLGREIVWGTTGDRMANGRCSRCGRDVTVTAPSEGWHETKGPALRERRPRGGIAESVVHQVPGGGSTGRISTDPAVTHGAWAAHSSAASRSGASRMT